MSNVIEFLEQMGRDAHLRHAGGAQIAQALKNAHIDPAVQSAILDEDQSRLEALLGAATNVCCMVHAAEEADEEEPVLDRALAG